MPSYHSIHRLARSEPHPDLDSGNTVPWERKYIALCGYIGYSRKNFVAVKRGVTCLRCQKKMQSNTRSHPTGGTGLRPLVDGSFGDFDWSDITQEPPAGKA